MRAIALSLLCAFALGCPLSEVSRVERITLMTPDMAWLVDVRPDGSVRAQYGSSVGDELRLPSKTVDFKELYLRVERYAQDRKDKEHTVSVAVKRKGVHSTTAVCMSPEHLPEIFLKPEEQEWQSSPGFRERMIEISKKHPISFTPDQ